MSLLTDVFYDSVCKLQRKRVQRGAVLIISLVFLMVLTLLGITAMQGTTQEEKMGGNARQRVIAFQAAESGMRAVTPYLDTLTSTTAFNNTIAGLHAQVVPSTNISDYWLNTYQWTASAGTDAGSMLCTVTGNNPTACTDTALKTQPCCVVERLTSTTNSSGGSLQAGKPLELNITYLYRITTRATGSTGDAVVILQSIYQQ